MRKVFLVLAFFLAACQTTGGSSTIGSGPITLSPQMQAYLDQYMSANGKVFAMTIDGSTWASYRYCPEIRCRDTVGERQKVIDHCEKGSNGVPCKIYAIRKEVVWDFDGPALDQSSSEQEGSFVQEKPTNASVLLQVSWAGNGPSMAGWLDVRNDQIKLQLPNGDWCSGPSRLKTKTDPGAWSVDCPNGATVSGDYSNTTWDSGVKGRGEDIGGNFVTFWRANT